MNDWPPKARPKTLKAQTYEVLQEMIAAHRFSAGKKINIEQIAAELNVSRTPVWQALKELEEQGLVHHVPNQGIFMTSMTPSMAADLYLVRAELEGLAVKLAAKQIDDEELAELEDLLAEQETVVDRGDTLAYSKADFKFHAVIYRACRNWILTELLANIKQRTRPMNRDISPILPELLGDHAECLRALKAGDAKAAEKAMRRHNNRMRRFMKTMKQASPAAEPSPKKRKEGLDMED